MSYPPVLADLTLARPSDHGYDPLPGGFGKCRGQRSCIQNAWLGYQPCFGCMKEWSKLLSVGGVFDFGVSRSELAGCRRSAPYPRAPCFSHYFMVRSPRPAAASQMLSMIVSIGCHRACVGRSSSTHPNLPPTPSANPTRPSRLALDGFPWPRKDWR